MAGFSTLLMIWAAYVQDSDAAARRLRRCKWWSSGRSVFVIPTVNSRERSRGQPAPVAAARPEV